MKLPFIAPVAGVTFHPNAVTAARAGDRVRVAHDPSNRHDACAVAVHNAAGEPLGHLPAAVAAKVVARFGHSCTFAAEIAEVVGGRDGHSTGLRIRLLGLTGNVGATPDGADTGTVRSLSGRTLGSYVGSDGDDVLVATDAGNTRYPAHLVTITPAA